MSNQPNQYKYINTHFTRQNLAKTERVKELYDCVKGIEKYNNSHFILPYRLLGGHKGIKEYIEARYKVDVCDEYEKYKPKERIMSCGNIKYKYSMADIVSIIYDCKGEGRSIYDSIKRFWYLVDISNFIMDDELHARWLKLDVIPPALPRQFRAEIDRVSKNNEYYWAYSIEIFKTTHAGIHLP